MNIIYTSPDGLFGVITGADYNAVFGQQAPNAPARSKTRDDPQKALNATWEPALVKPVGPGSLGDFVKVRLSDLPNQGPRPQVVLSPGNYTNAKAPKFIPQYPHTCHVCGGKMLILFSSVEHEGGACPGAQKKSVRRF